MDINPSMLGDVTQIITSLGVILTAVSSILNRFKLSQVGDKVDTAVSAAEAAKTTARRVAVVQSARLEEVKAVVIEAKEAAVAVNAEVVAEVHQAGVELGKEIATNGKH